MDEIITGTTFDPHAVLGAHPHADRTTIRTLRRGAREVTAVVDGDRYPMARVHQEGIFEVALPRTVGDYQIDVDGVIVNDPYRYPPTLGDLDLHLIQEGRHERLWQVLGARVRAEGVAFAVWAPNAQGVRLIGDFGGWGPHDGWPMRSLGASGVWELLVPDAHVGQRYKYRILGPDGQWREKADPMARRTEIPPRTASVIDDSAYTWGDGQWMGQRSGAAAYRDPVSVYEMHLGSWRPGLSYAELADALPAYLREMGFTHVELMPVMEHPYAPSWGYQVTGYYAPTARFGDPDGLRLLIDRLHQAGIGVILDWVPAHFPRDEWALARFDGTPLYEHGDPLRGEHPDWGTLIFDYGRPEVRNFLVANALYWCDEFHADGLRVDAVASMLYLDYSRKEGQWQPNALGGRENLDAISFLQEMNATVYREHPGVMTLAEESTAWSGVTQPTTDGGLGFGFKWNMGWMNDTLTYVAREPIHRRWHHQEMTFAGVYAWTENFMLPLSHDEVVHGKRSLLSKMPGDLWKRLATLRSLYAFMWAFPGKQLLFMGSELADDREWSEERGLDWGLRDDPARAGVGLLLADLNRVYRGTPALWVQDSSPSGFRWIAPDDENNNTFSFLRFGHDGEVLACVVNFADTPHEGYRLGLPSPGRWAELINTDATVYGGSGVGNLGAVDTTDTPSHGLPVSAVLRLPPLGGLWLRRQ